MRKIISVSILLLLYLPSLVQATSIPEYDKKLVRSYKIIKTEDASIRALDRAPSTYNSTEIKNASMNVRKSYRIVIASDISKEGLKSTLIQVIIDKTLENPDIDEVAVFAYDRKEDINNAYTFGKVEWCPNGNWSGVTAKIASTNDRSSYKYNFEIKEKVGNISASDRPTEKEFKIYNAFDKLLWAEPDTSEEILLRRVAKQFSISEKEIDDIYMKVMQYNMK